MSLLVIVVVVVMKGTREKKKFVAVQSRKLIVFYMSAILSTDLRGPKGEILLYASTRVRFHFVLRHSRHLSVTTVSLSYVPFIIVYHRLSVFRLSSFSSLQIYSAPVMFRASFLGFVAALSYFNIFTFLWLDNKFIVFVIL